MIKIKSKKKLADCRLKTEDTRHSPHFAYCLSKLAKIPLAGLPTAYLFRLLLTAFCLLAFTTEINPTIRYVSKTGSSTPPYTTWETAADSIQKCIDISEFGDTIYVGNGVYKEQIIMIPGLTLFGAGMDSCIIDTRTLNHTDFNAVTLKDSCTFRDFQVIISEPHIYLGTGLRAEGSTGEILHNIIINGNTAIRIFNSNTYAIENYCLNQIQGISISYSSSIIKSNTITSNYQEGGGNTGIIISDLFHTATPQILNNYVEAGSAGIRITLGTFITTIANNIVVLTDRFSGGISTGSADTTHIYNNLVLTGSFNNTTGISSTLSPKSIFNNLVIGNGPQSIGISINGDIPNIINNLLINTQRGIERYGTGSVSAYYNNAWNNLVSYKNFIPDTTNISVDPMLMNEDSLDFRLQMYSPLIDAGDPNILDVDGSRSDIGLYGGPYGMSYQYVDLPPRPPVNVIAVLDSPNITIKWNKNTEADFYHYLLFRDTSANFTADSTKLVMSLRDTSYKHIIPPGIDNYYYKLTAVDNQGNESLPSEEIAINITSLTINEYPITINDYILYQNYPNPFNPFTKISYRLKEGGYVKLYVYDIRGELVNILVNQHQEGGYYEVEFSPSRKVAGGIQDQGSSISDLASGIYIYQIMVRSNNNIPVFTDSKKMLYLK